jgi:hypothetical protein
MNDKIKIHKFLPLYKTKDKKIVSYGWRSLPPFLSKDKRTIKKYNVEQSEKNFHENENIGIFSES